MVPRIGVFGYVICIFITELVNLAFSLSRLITVTGVTIPIIKAIVFPILCISGATALSMIILKSVHQTEVFWILILGITLCAVFYMILLRTTSAINKEDSAWLKGMLKGS